MPLIVQRASAGSGKTEQLARRYVQILLAGTPSGHAVDPATILAATFTREAAGEIMARIFKILALACEHEEACQKLVEGTDLPRPTRTECQKLLRCLMERIDRLNIGTIDALFAQQARALALDFGLSPYWEVADVLTSITLARQAILQLLEEDVAFSQAWKRLHQFRRRLSFVEEAAVLLEKNRFIAHEAPHEIFSLPSTPPRLLSATEAEGTLHFLEHFTLPATAQGKPNGHWVAALKKLREAFEQPLALKDLLGLGALLTQCLEEEPSFFGKPISEEFLTHFFPLAEASREEQQRLALLREQALYGLVQQYRGVREVVSFQTGQYTFSEVEEAVVTSEALSREEMEFRMESRTEHLLLDEYQDTSQRQHDFLAPLVGDVLAKGGHAFVVGDVKQGIYGWRGGKRHLLRSLEESYELYLQETAPLHKSYRSSKAVLDAVNEVFGALKNREKCAAMNAGSAFENAAARWSLDFQPQEGATAVEQLRGEVILHEVALDRSSSKEDAMEAVLHKVVELVKVHREQDPLREVAVLVRRTKFIPQLLLKLRHYGILASGEGGNPLADTLAVEVFLSLLLWIDHPGHRAAYEHVRSSPLGTLLEEKQLSEAAGAAVLRASLMDLGMANSLRQWSSHPAFQEACSGYEQARIEQLLAMAHRFDASGGGTPSEFVKRVRQERVESPLSRGVRVLSMHAAKGLEFEAVILMDLDTDIFAGAQETLRVKQTEEGNFFIQTSQEMMALQGRGDLLTALQEEQWAEALSLLYVGMTRAISYLDLVVLGEQASSKKSMAQWLRTSGLTEHHVEGRSWRQPPSKADSVVVQEAFSSWEKNQHHEHGLKKLLKRSPSEENEGGLVLLAQKFQKTTARDQGVLQHALLAEVLWIDPGHPAPEKLAERFQQEKALAEVFNEQHFLDRWKTLGVTHLEVWRERRFAVVLEHETELLTGAFDRVVIGHGDRPLVAEIIDFKTAPLLEKDREKRARNYQPQLKAYRAALKKLLPSLTAIETKIVWV